MQASEDDEITALPCLLSADLDFACPGVMLKHVTSNKYAMIVDSGGDRHPVAVRGKSESEFDASTPDDFELFAITDPDEWIVLAHGQDHFILNP